LESEELVDGNDVAEEAGPDLSIKTTDISNPEPPKRSISPIRPPDGSSTSNKPISPILPPAAPIISPIFPPSGSKVIIQREPIPEQPGVTLAAPAKPAAEARADLLRQKLLQERAVKGSLGEKKPRITRSNL
jgi:hypothetical protein